MIAFSPIRQHPEVLELFLRHLLPEVEEVWVYDDNTDPDSSALLQGLTVLPKIPDLDASIYERGIHTHQWNLSTFHRVAAIKNAAIDRFLRQSDAECLFLIDSDVLIRPGTLTHLDEAGLPILCSVFWTKWSPHHGRGPNSWGSKPEPLLVPGHHEVVGLGACTLIRREVLKRARFTPVPHLKTEGEDRWFCFRARAAGYKLVMCSHLEPFHVYRDSEIQAAREWSNTLGDVQPVL